MVHKLSDVCLQICNNIAIKPCANILATHTVLAIVGNGIQCTHSLFSIHTGKYVNWWRDYSYGSNPIEEQKQSEACCN